MSHHLGHIIDAGIFLSHLTKEKVNILVTHVDLIDDADSITSDGSYIATRKNYCC
jgi:hypothetical protein